MTVIVSSSLVMAEPITTPFPQLTGTNIVQNGGFESGISPWILGISNPQFQGYAGTLTQNSNAYSGSYSGLFTVTGNPQGGSGYITVIQTLPAQAGQTYTLQLYYKGTLTVWPHIFCFDSSWSKLGLYSGPTLSPKTTWSPITMTFFVPSGTTTTQIHFNAGSTGVFQVDNVVATNPTSNPSPSPTLTIAPTPTTTPKPTPIPTITPNPTATPTPIGTNIVQNGGFESGISPWILGISNPQFQGYAGTLTQNSNAYSGSYSGLFTVTGNPQGGSGYITVIQTLPAQAGQTYTLQLYYKGTLTVWPHIFCFDSSWSKLGLYSGPTLSPKTTWSPITMTFFVPSGTTTTQIHFNAGSTGVFQVDNVVATNPTSNPSPSPTLTIAPTPTTTPKPTPIPTITPNPTATPTPIGTNIVQNGGFESGISPWILGISNPQFQGYAGTLTQNSNAYSGSYSGLFTVTGNPQGGSGYITVIQTLPAQAGQTYTLQLYYKGTLTVWPHIFCFDSSWSKLGLYSGPTLSPKTTWSPITMTFFVPSGTTTTQIHFNAGSTGVFQVDNVVATNPTSNPSPSPTLTIAPTPTTTPKPTPIPTITPNPTATPTPKPTETYTYVIKISGSNYQMTDGTTGQIKYQSTNAAQVINNAIGNLTQNQSIQFSSGTYKLQKSITGAYKNNIALDFVNDATLFVANSMNAPAISLVNCNNWLIRGVTIDGNAGNQLSSSLSHGIKMWSCTNCRVDQAKIYNCRIFGFLAQGPGSVNDGITNSKITFCGWNGITLGMNYGELRLYATNNEVAYSSDVGITNYGINALVAGNYVHDINGTTGYINSRWGIATEGGTNDTITNNTISVVNMGIMISNGADNCIVSLNTISDWDTYGWGVGGIEVFTNNGNYSKNQLIYTGHITTEAGIVINVGSNNIVSSNQIACGSKIHGSPPYAIEIGGGTTSTTISSNTITAVYTINDAGTNTKIFNNQITTP